MNWTQEQLAAINYRGGGAIISAAAGSGKTAVLVERACRIIADSENRVAADRLVITTFTKKAAEEIRVRLTDRLHKILREQEGAPPSYNHSGASWLEQQLIYLEEAQITTISSFCLSLLRGFEDRFGLSSGFRVLDETQSEEYLKRALDFTMQNLYENFSDNEADILHKISGNSGSVLLRDILTGLYFSAMQSPYSDEWLVNKVSDYPQKDKFFKFAENEIRKDANHALDLAYELDGILEKPSAALAFDIEILEELSVIELSACEAERVLNVSASALRFRSPPKSDELIKELRVKIKEYADRIFNILKLIKSFDEAAERQIPVIEPLIKLYNIFTAEFKRLKTGANALDFNDVEHYCLKLLQTQGMVLGALYDEIIVDEFQDSNFVQYEIFKLLSRDESNLFFVGDVKQSIYRFRSADPAVFTSVIENPKYSKLYLNRNFRSSDEVINSVNDVFTGVMTKDFGGIDYDGSQRLVPKQDNISYGERGKTKLYILSRDERLNLEYTTDEFEAGFIANHIKLMVEKGYEILGEGDVRNCNYGDFAVIFSALSSAEKIYLNVFQEYGIPVGRGGKGGEYIKLKEIDAVLKLLEVIFDPYKDFELLCVLMSPLFGFNAGEIAEIRLSGKGLPLYSNLLASKKTIKIENFLKHLINWRSISENSPLKSLIADIAGSKAASCLVAASGSPQKAVANINLLKQYAHNLSELTGGSSHTFLRLMKALKDTGKKLAEADVIQNSENGMVKLMTIHASKGLEFPICYLPGMSKKFNLRDSFGNVITDSKFGIAMRYIEPYSKIKYETLSHFAAAEHLKSQAKDEEMRKLYVAMTRARDRLILVGTDRIDEMGGLEISNNKNPLSSDSRPNVSSWVNPVNKDSYIQILLKSGCLPLIFPKAEHFMRESCSLKFDSENLSIEEYNIKTNENKYHRHELTLIPKKLTATEINLLKIAGGPLSEIAASDEPSIFPRLPSFLKEKRLTGKKRGDVYHKVMEIIDFAKGDYSAQLLKLETRFTEQEWKAIDQKHILDFFESPLGRRAVLASRSNSQIQAEELNLLKTVEKEFPIYTEVSFSELGFDALNQRYKERSFVQGIADMFFYEGDGIILVDYKTNRNWSLEKLKIEYAGQLLLYKRAIEEMTGILVKECWIYSFDVGGVKI